MKANKKLAKSCVSKRKIFLRLNWRENVFFLYVVWCNAHTLLRTLVLSGKHFCEEKVCSVSFSLSKVEMCSLSSGNVWKCLLRFSKCCPIYSQSCKFVKISVKKRKKRKKASLVINIDLLATGYCSFQSSSGWDYFPNGNKTYDVICHCLG